ncbi:MAG: hypothetical protein RL358_652 [Pseudomonadota bacterium]|jgi:flagellar protein FliT
MNAPKIISHYESLATITAQMRDAAVNEQWDQLIILERQCSAQVATMKPIDAVVKLDEAARQRKIQLIHKILSDDKEIRNHTEGWMEQLQRIMQSNHQEQRLHQAYSVGY